jgi:putative membrane protein
LTIAFSLAREFLLASKIAIMKKRFSQAALILATLVWSCSDNNTHGEDTTTTDSTHSTNTTATVNTVDTPAVDRTPLSKEDSMFVLEAASGGMMEVEAGTMAQQKGASQGVKDFGSMMVRDHSQANNELKSFASSHNFMLTDSMMPKHRTHITAMQKMEGKAFDNHYMIMMLKDHKEDVAKFEKMSTTATNPDLKNWAAKTLPVLKTHLDSAQAVSKRKM